MAIVSEQTAHRVRHSAATSIEPLMLRVEVVSTPRSATGNVHGERYDPADTKDLNTLNSARGTPQKRMSIVVASPPCATRRSTARSSYAQ